LITQKYLARNTDYETHFYAYKKFTNETKHVPCRAVCPVRQALSVVVIIKANYFYGVSPRACGSLEMNLDQI